MEQQGTPEWRMARVGKVTASRFKDAMTKPRSKSQERSDTAESYAMELVGERLAGMPMEEFSSVATRWGKDHEPQARDSYVFTTGATVQEVGFAVHPDHPGIGCSLDSLVGTDGTLEIKCPYTFSEHARVLVSGEMPDDHIYQVQGGLWIANRKWCDFVSYHPLFPDGLTTAIIRVERDDEFIGKIIEAVVPFADYVDSLYLKATGNAG